MAVPKPRQAETFRTEISRLNHQSVAAFNGGDMSACAGFYADDATMLLPDRPPVKGRAATLFPEKRPDRGRGIERVVIDRTRDRLRELALNPEEKADSPDRV